MHFASEHPLTSLVFSAQKLSLPSTGSLKLSQIHGAYLFLIHFDASHMKLCPHSVHSYTQVYHIGIHYTQCIPECTFRVYNIHSICQWAQEGTRRIIMHQPHLVVQLVAGSISNASILLVLLGTAPKGNSSHLHGTFRHQKTWHVVLPQAMPLSPHSQ